MIKNDEPRSTAIRDLRLRLVRLASQGLRGARAREVMSSISSSRRLASCVHGIGSGPGSGATPQIADAQGGSGGVGMMYELPWVDAVPPVMHLPVKVLMSG